jgi:hypothetical protein
VPPRFSVVHIQRLITLPTRLLERNRHRENVENNLGR